MKTYKLSDIVSTYSGGTPSRSKAEYFNGDIPWIKSGELNSFEILKTEEFITKAGLKNSSAKIAPKDTLLLALYGATAGVCSFTRIDAAISQAILAIQPKEFVDSNYLF
jgi:type I restriction enzyme S subunit